MYVLEVGELLKPRMASIHNARTGMEERDEEATVPKRECLAVIGSKRGTETIQETHGSQRYATKRDDDLGCDNVNLPLQVDGTVADLIAGRWSIAATGIAGVTEYSVGNENAVSGESCRGEEPLEVSARGVAVERDARTISAMASWSFGDEHDRSTGKTILRAEDSTLLRQARTAPAFHRLLEQAF